MNRVTSKHQRAAEWRRQIHELGLRSERFGRVEYLCTATDYEQHQLWERYHCYLGLGWTGHSWSTALEIGHIVIAGEQFPLMANVDYADVCGHLVAFVHSQSRYTDYTLLEEWRGIAYPNAQSHADAWNFANLVHAMAKQDGVANYFARKPVLIDSFDASRDGIPTLETIFPEMSLQDRFTFAERKMQDWGERARAYQEALKAGYEA